MTGPKRRHSKARRDKRRSANSKLTTPNLILCSNCYEPKLPHRICPHCGYYKGRQVIQVKEI